MIRHALATLAVVAAAASGWAQQPIHETRPAAPDATISVNNVDGSITVTGWSKEEIEITGTLSREVERLDVSGDRSRWQIRVVLPKHTHETDDTNLVVKVPAAALVDLNSVSADIDVDDLSGRVEAQSVSGDITVAGSPSTVSAQSVSGDVEVTAATPEVRATSVSGDVTVTAATGTVEISTVSGDMTLGGGPLSELRAKTTSGDLECDARLTPRGTLTLESLSGDVRLTVPKGFPADYEITTFSGEIDNSFGPKAERQHKYGPGSELSFANAGGGARIEVKTFSGNLQLDER